MSGNESGVIDAFNDYMRETAADNGVTYQPFALGSADRDLADYLLSSESRYVLVEFKDSEYDLNSERKKPKRLKLCKALEHEPSIEKLHDRCHFISWVGQRDSRLWLNIYRHEVCNCKRMGKECGLAKKEPNKDERIGADTFAQSFFAKISTRGVEFSTLRSYVDWVIKQQGGQEDVSLVMRDKGVATIKRVGLDELHRALQQTPPPSPPVASKRPNAKH
ncbi:hypothetical protein KTD55_32530 [Burkholderia gladioli]|uniref:hypothetical protein n=1 Tax=Burkholderia gladioli TaxID=28095 RepID=UPI001C24589A|nr:hypothetical protein [Burkholderia gladioli]MBU9218788.1 hypothetical protein [Burkholderia gladioli]MDN7728097.1 hypothetical protein [Burkholderia gladioli]